ncbi:MAG: hypothetical protein B6244_09005 [Candidatus Cloacimonetes bacterium 4572_55]|nr:MAG: hypothetical protein B6244_09005 [Candidatus Cloacimonetes bacterium 4572_55]
MKKIILLSLLVLILQTLPAQARRSAEDHLTIAQTLIDSMRYEQATIHLRRAIEMDTTLAQGYRSLGSIYEGWEAYEDAFDVYQTGCQILSDEEICAKAEELSDLIEQSEDGRKTRSIGQSICLLMIFSTNYDDIKEAKKMLSEGSYFPDVAEKYSQTGVIKQVDCYESGNIDPMLVPEVEKLATGSISDVLTNARGYYILLKVFQGKTERIKQYPWEPVLQAIRDSLGIHPPEEVAEADSVEAGETETRSRRSRRGKSESDTIVTTIVADVQALADSSAIEIDSLLATPDFVSVMADSATVASGSSAAVDSVIILEEPEGSTAPDSAQTNLEEENVVDGNEQEPPETPVIDPNDDPNIAPMMDIFNNPTTIFYHKSPELIERVEPEHPEAWQNRGGEVTLHVLIDDKGKVLNVKVKESFDDEGVMGFNQLAIKAIMQWKYKPATRYDKPLMVWITERIVFAEEEAGEE